MKKSSKEKYFNGGWWDNSAFLDVLGFKGELQNNLNLHKGKLSYIKKMKLISQEWNSVPSSSNLDFSLERNSMLISRKVVYTNLDNILKADVVEIDIKTKDTKIFMYENQKKINIKSIN